MDPIKVGTNLKRKKLLQMNKFRENNSHCKQNKNIVSFSQNLIVCNEKFMKNDTKGVVKRKKLPKFSYIKAKNLFSF